MDFEQIKRVVFDLERMGVEGTPQFALARLACEDLAYSTFGLTDFGRASQGPALYTDDATQCMDGELLERAARLERYRKREANTARKSRRHQQFPVPHDRPAGRLRSVPGAGVSGR